MAEPNYTISLNARLSGATSIAVGQFAVKSGSTYLPATTANRGTKRSSMIALSAASSLSQSFIGQGAGDVPASVTGLAAGSASWVRVSATGYAERAATPTTGDDVVGFCEADGTLHLMCGILTPAMVTASSGGTSIANTTTLEENGAVGDGVTNDSAAFTAALATGKTILLGAKTYLVSTGGTLPAGSAIVGVGDMSVLKTAGSTSVIVIGGDGCVLKDFKILGVSGGSASQVGVQNGLAGAGTGYTNLRISGVHCKDLGGHGFMMQNTDGGSTDIGPILTECTATGCGSNAVTPGAGFYMAAEYTTLVGCKATYNTGYAMGLQVNAGNVAWTGGQITQNGIGVKINAGSNDAHGIVSGVQINHNSTSIDIDNIANGHTFIGCHIYSNQIWLRGSNGVRFVGCTIGTDVAFNASQNTVFQNCCFPTGSACNLYQSYGGASTEEFIGCYDLAGAPFAAATGSTDTNLVKNYWASRITLTPANASYTEKVENLVARRIRYTTGGGIAGPITITYPTPIAARDYFEKTIHNTTGFTLTFKIAGGAGVAIANNKTAIIGFDSVSEYRVTADA